MILVDTSVWVDHFRRGDSLLERHLNNGEVFCHPFVVGELACGNLRRRDEILSLLSAMPSAAIATHEEALLLSTEQRLFGRGIGWVDVHLLASSILSRSTFWTRDKALKAAAEGLQVGYDVTR